MKIDLALKMKVCGMKFPENIEEIASLEPDFMGFIFDEASKRNFEGKMPFLDPKIRKTGVFVNASEEFIRKKVEKYNLSAIQLHGEESPEFCAALQHPKMTILKAFSVGDDFDFEVVKKYEGKVDFFLFDTKGKEKGGNGIVFDWNILKKYPSKTPFFLSGGIGIEEVEEIKKLYDFFKNEGKQHLFYGIDVNSKFEIEPGIKNFESLKEFRKKLQ